MRRAIPTIILVTTVLAGCVQDVPTALQPDLSAPQTALAAGACENVRGEGVMDIFDPATPPITMGGDLAGIVFPGMVEFLPHGQGAYHGLFYGDEFVTDDHGTFQADSRVIFTPVATPLERWNGQFEITGGEQVTSGFLRMHGTLDLATGRGEFRYHGRICGDGLGG